MVPTTAPVSPTDQDDQEKKMKLSVEKKQLEKQLAIEL